MSITADNSSIRRGASAVKSSITFNPGQMMFLRCKQGKLDRVIPVICQGVTQPGNVLAVQWTEDSIQSGGAPADAQEVQCHMLTAGVLYLAKGQVCGSSSGRLPRVRIRVSENCVGVKLRSQQRYAVRGKLEILEPGGAVAFAHSGYQKMNISLGGFGVSIPEHALPKQKFNAFRLEAFVEEDAKPNRDAPVLALEGESELRHTHPSNQEGMIYAGFSFTNLSDANHGVLQFWLAVNSPLLSSL